MIVMKVMSLDTLFTAPGFLEDKELQEYCTRKLRELIEEVPLNLQFISVDVIENEHIEERYVGW